MSICKLLILVLVSACLWGCGIAPPPAQEERARYELVSWSKVEGWNADRVEEAWSAFLLSCKAIGARPEWQQTCSAAASQVATDVQSIRRFLEAQLAPYRILTSNGSRETHSGLITGYYEPLLMGSRQPSPQFNVPLYGPPDDLLTIELGDVYPELKGKRLRGRLQGRKVVPYPNRGEMQSHAALRGKELIWVDSAVDAFFLEVQGSGRVQLDDGETIRLSYSDQNGHPYRAIGRYLVDRGELTVEQASAQGIRQWLAAHPQRMNEVLNANPSAVFFRTEKVADPNQGPRGALAVPLTPGRSIAVDPQFISLGTPVFLSTTYPNSEVPLQRLVMAQDTGGAIRGALRADFFWGFGAAAGEHAGTMRQQGQLWLLWPRAASPPSATR